MNGLLPVWWRFFWRYAILFIALLLVGGTILNALVWLLPNMTLLYFVTLLYSGLVNICASVVVFFYILNRRFKRSSIILVLNTPEPTFRTKLQSWFHYYWRFLLFSFSLSLLLGGLLPLVARIMGYDPLSVLKYSKYVGNFSMIPASFLAFWLFLRQARRKGIMQIATYAC